MNRKDKLKDNLYLIPLIGILTSLMSVISILQLPLGTAIGLAPFLNLDFSLVVLVTVQFLLGYKITFIMAILSPWIALPFMTLPDVVGAFSLMLLNLQIIFTFEVMNKILKVNFNKPLGFLITSVIVTIVTGLSAGIIGALITYPIYFGKYDWNTITFALANSIPFTLLKMVIIFAATTLIYPSLKFAFENRRRIINNKKW